ncbi:MAG: hypothetical protein HY506_00430 [Candidatus Yanofskybacteria bacterium]|nr:hypothetical protein [Candidatus Yanofskybacteria bacterium]
MAGNRIRLPVFLLLILGAGMYAQESPVIIDFDREHTSVTVFTNWQLIELVYTLRYLDGFEILPEAVGPEKMSFGMQPDPEKGQKLIRRNKRRYKKENYEDLVYYVRHIGEKKGKITIPEQTFQYIKITPGQTKRGSQVYEVRSPSVTIRYDSVLTEDADDIMDVIDFGSFEKWTYFWKGISVGLPFLACLALFLLFRTPVVTRKVVSGSKNKVGPSGKVLDQPEERLIPSEALKLFIESLDGQWQRFGDASGVAVFDERGERIKLLNGLTSLLLSFEPSALDSDIPKEIALKIKNNYFGREKEALLLMADELVRTEHILYGEAGLVPSVGESNVALRAISRDLRAGGSKWRRFRAWLAGIFGRSAR